MGHDQEYVEDQDQEEWDILWSVGGGVGTSVCVIKPGDNETINYEGMVLYLQWGNIPESESLCDSL